MRINNKYVKEGNIDVNEIFELADLTSDLKKYSVSVVESVEGLLKVIDMPECPNVGICENCFKPYECPLKYKCFEHVPEKSVFEFHGMWKSKQFKYYDAGKSLMSDVAEKNLKDCSIIARKAHGSLAIIGAKYRWFRYRPWLKYKGFLSNSEKCTVLAKSSALLFPVRWH